MGQHTHLTRKMQERPDMIDTSTPQVSRALSMSRNSDDSGGIDLEQGCTRESTGVVMASSQDQTDLSPGGGTPSECQNLQASHIHAQETKMVVRAQWNFDDNADAVVETG